MQDAKTFPPAALQSIALSEVALRPGATLHFREPLVLFPRLSESGDYLLAEHPRLHVDVFAETREGLLSELHEQVRMLWAEYALEDEENLADPAIALRRAWLAAAEEIRDAAREA